VSSLNQKNLRRRKQRIDRRIAPRNWRNQPRPMFKASNIRYEVANRTRATGAGGLGAIHMMVRRLGLDRRINEGLSLLKVHLPYHESDHVLNIAYNILAGGTRLEDLELLRHDESYMDLLGAQRIPDPTTEGDFLRRFHRFWIERLMDVVNGVRVRVWKGQSKEFRRKAVIDMDGVLAPTDGEKKRGMDISYKGIWGYCPLVVSLANSQEPLYVVNRPGNAASQSGAVKWVDKAIGLCEGVFDEILLRGDTAFSLTGEFDRWTDRGVWFVFGYDAHPNLEELAESLSARAYRPLRRRRGWEVKTRCRWKRENVKERIVEARGYRNKKLESEEYAAVEYQPSKCGRPYRLVILRKTISVREGQQLLFNEVEYFFYITNDRRMPAREVIRQANARCDQENVIEQLKNGVNALRVPVYDLVSNWAYMVIASLAWSLKAWFGLTLRRWVDREKVVRMEFKRFLNQLMRIPCQVVKGAGQIRLRILGYTEHVRLLLASLKATVRLCEA
jgi:hypothetical protein